MLAEDPMLPQASASDFVLLSVLVFFVLFCHVLFVLFCVLLDCLMHASVYIYSSEALKRIVQFNAH